MRKMRKYFESDRFDKSEINFIRRETCFAKNKKLPTSKELRVSAEHYLLGLCDLTGEIMRRVVNDVISENYDHAEILRQFVDTIYGEFLKFEFRNGDLRRKSDQIKWNLHKIEDTMYDVKMRTSKK